LGSYQVTSGTTKAYTVTPSAGYQIANVTGCNGKLNGNTYPTGAITGACTVSATFAPTTTYYTVSANVTGNIGGTITPSVATVAAGTAAKFTVNLNPGYFNSSGSDGCGGAGTYSGNPLTTNPVTYTTVPITNNCSITMTFAPQT
jgi:hypothetical protein